MTSTLKKSEALESKTFDKVSCIDNNTLMCDLAYVRRVLYV